MKLFRFAMLILVQLSPIFVHINGEDVPEYKCVEEHITEQITVGTFGVAKLAKGCVLKNAPITFDIKAMYEAASKTPKSPVVIGISGAHFIDSFIRLMNAKDIPDLNTRGPLLFTMDKAVLSGFTTLEFGHAGQLFKIPPHSRITIINSEMTLTSNAGTSNIFVFDSLELVTNSSMEIANNVISMKCEGCNFMNVFFTPGKGMNISYKSSFTLRNNNISMEGHTTESLSQYLWWQPNSSPMTISETSTYTWVSNIISIVGYKVKSNRQQIWYHDAESPITITKTSIYTWESNTISMTGYDVTERLVQEVWVVSKWILLVISEKSNYTLVMNIITIDGYNASSIYQSVFYNLCAVMISSFSHFIFDYNSILLLSKDRLTKFISYIMMFDNLVEILNGSSMTLRGNCIGMGHKETDNMYALSGSFTISNESELLLDGNYLTTTKKYSLRSAGMTDLMWGPKNADTHLRTKGKLTIKNTRVYSNSAAEGGAGSLLWDSPPYTKDTDVKQPDMKWGSSPAKDSSGSLIPTWTYDNLKQRICPPKPKSNPGVPTPEPGKPITPNPTNTAKGKSATAISSTIPAVLITSVVFLYLYIW